MSLIRIYGNVKSKRLDDYGNVHVSLDVKESYVVNHINNIRNLGDHKLRTDTFMIKKKRPLSCVNDYDLALSCSQNDRVVLCAYELFDFKDNPVNRYDVVNFDVSYQTCPYI